MHETELKDIYKKRRKKVKRREIWFCEFCVWISYGKYFIIWNGKKKKCFKKILNGYASGLVSMDVGKLVDR